jgi:hypothetical protein
MNDALRRKCDAILKLLAQAAVGVLLSRADGVVRELARKSTELLARMNALGPAEDERGTGPATPRSRELTAASDERELDENAVREWRARSSGTADARVCRASATTDA